MPKQVAGKKPQQKRQPAKRDSSKSSTKSKTNKIPRAPLGSHIRPVQYFSDAYLEQCRNVSPQEIVEFLEQFRLLHSGEPPAQAPHAAQKSKLISIKIPQDLLAAFQAKAKITGTPYQTQIKVLMRQWLKT